MNWKSILLVVGLLVAPFICGTALVLIGLAVYRLFWPCVQEKMLAEPPGIEPALFILGSGWFLFVLAIPSGIFLWQLFKKLRQRP